MLSTFSVTKPQQALLSPWFVLAFCWLDLRHALLDLQNSPSFYLTMLYPSFSAVTSPQGHPDLPLHNEQSLSSPCPDANTRHGSVVTGHNYFICFPQWQELHLFFGIDEQSLSWHLTHDGDALYSCLCCLGMDGRVTSDSTYKDAHQPHLFLPSPEQWHPMNHRQVLQQASLKQIFEAVSRSASQLLFLLTAFSDTCEDKDLGHLSPSFLPVHSACEEAMTQKTNGPGSLTTTMISLSVIFLLQF